MDAPRHKHKFILQSISQTECDFHSSKINHLLKIWPQKTIAVQSWLSQMDFERQLMAVRGELMGIGGIEKLPAIQWKLLNIGKTRSEETFGGGG